MLKRRINSEDKYFIKIVLCIFRHARGEIDFGVLKDIENSYSLPHIFLKKGEKIDETISMAMNDYAGNSWADLPFGGEKKNIGFVDSDKDSTVTMLYRIDIPATSKSDTGLTWLDTDSLFEATHDEERMTEDTKKIILDSIYSA